LIKHSMKLAACFGILGAAVLANNAMAMSQDECERLSGNMFLAAIERGDCELSIQTAAGPDQLLTPDDDGDRSRDGRNGRSGQSSDSGSSGRGGGYGGNGPNKP
jgi:hypothetical protein